MVSNTCCHGGCSSQCLVDPAEVVKSEPQHNGRAMVLELFAESVRQASEAADTHPHGKVLAFDVRSANAFGIGSPDAWDHLRTHHFSRRIPSLAFRRGAVDLDELGKIAAVVKGICDSRAVRREPIRGELKMSRSGLPETFNENVGAGLVTAANSDIQGQFAIGFDGDEGIAVAEARIIARAAAFLFLLDEAPDFVSLHVPDGDVRELPAHQLFALFTGQHEQLQNRRVVNFRQALNARHAVTFEQEPKNHFGFLDRQVHAVESTVAGVCENLVALRTLVALAAATLTEFPAFSPA